LEISWWFVHCEHDEVDLVGTKPPQPLRAAADPHADPHLGAALSKSLQVAGQEVGRGGLSSPDGESVRHDAVVLLGKGVGQTVHTLHQGHRELVEVLAHGGEGDARPATFEQSNPEFIFERAYLVRDGRLAALDITRSAAREMLPSSAA
jgi:hypothetical protein